MNPHTQSDAADALSWLGAANTGLGIVLMAAFPLALPLLILTAIAALPLVLLAIPVGFVILVRRIARYVRAAAESRGSTRPTDSRLRLHSGQGLLP